MTNKDAGEFIFLTYTEMFAIRSLYRDGNQNWEAFKSMEKKITEQLNSPYTPKEITDE